MVMLRPCTGVVSVSVLRVLVVAALGVGVTAMPRDASAQGGARRARLSLDLQRQLESGNLRDETVILTGSAAQIARVAERHGLTVRKWLETAAVIDVPAASLGGVLEDADVDQISTNQILRSQMAVTNQTIGADLVQAGTWSESGVGYTGQGVGVALIDSGVAVLPQLRGRVMARVDFTARDGYGLDAYGHGTHIAGIIAAQAARPGGQAGVAPGAHIVSLKVLDENGRGTADLVIEAIDFAIANRARFNIKVINLSLGGAVLQPAADDPICQAVERAYRAGIVVVASAGNFGKTTEGVQILGGITTPGISPFAITVGAVNTKGTPWREDDEVASYSSRGPTRFDRLIKPDLVAPGNKIESLAAPNSTLVRTYPELVTGTGAAATLRLSGTSMAAGVVSGAAAVILESRPIFGVEAIRHRMQRTGMRSNAFSIVSSGTGSLDLIAALRAVEGAPSGLAFCTLVTCPVGLPEFEVQAWTETIVWSDSVDETIVWSDATDETIVWSDSLSETIVWSDSLGETIVWSDFLDETIVWSDSLDQTIVWSDAIVWSD